MRLIYLYSLSESLAVSKYTWSRTRAVFLLWSELYLLCFCEAHLQAACSLDLYLSGKNLFPLPFGVGVITCGTDVQVGVHSVCTLLFGFEVVVVTLIFISLKVSIVSEIDSDAPGSQHACEG